MRIAGAALAFAVVTATVAGGSPPAPIGWSIRTDGTYVHGITGALCPSKWGWVERIEVFGSQSGAVKGRCRYVGGDEAELRIRHFDPTAARDEKTLRNERNLMDQPGDSRSPFGYYTRWEEPAIGGRPIQVERYTMKRAGMLIDCETRFIRPNQSDVTLGFDGLCTKLQTR